MASGIKSKIKKDKEKDPTYFDKREKALAQAESSYGEAGQFTKGLKEKILAEAGLAGNPSGTTTSSTGRYTPQEGDSEEERIAKLRKLQEQKASDEKILEADALAKGQEIAKEQGLAAGLTPVSTEDVLRAARERQPPSSLEIGNVLEPFVPESALEAVSPVAILNNPERFSEAIRSTAIIAKSLAGGAVSVFKGSGDPFSDPQEQQVNSLLSDLSKYESDIKKGAAIDETELRQLEFQVAAAINQYEETLKGFGRVNPKYLKDRGISEQQTLLAQKAEFNRIRANIDTAFEIRDIKLGGGSPTFGS